MARIYFLLFLVMSFTAFNTYSGEQKVGEIVRNTDGSINYMTQDQAIKYCESQGQYLPSARELIQLTMKFGATGISETPKDGYSRLKVKNADGIIDFFYYNSAGYIAPTREFSNLWFWSSSAGKDTSGAALCGDWGYICFDYNFKYNAVICSGGL